MEDLRELLNKYVGDWMGRNYSYMDGKTYIEEALE